MHLSPIITTKKAIPIAQNRFKCFKIKKAPVKYKGKNY